MWNGDELLKMMQVNSAIFGDEITHIKDADDEYLINYFEKALVKLFPAYSFCKSKYCVCEYGGMGADVIAENLIKDGFGLTKEQCVEIGNFIIERCCMNRYTNKMKLHEYDTKIVLNYIEYGYELSCAYYKLVYKIQ